MDSAATEGRKELTGTAIQILWGKDLVSARTLQRHQSNIYSGLKQSSLFHDTEDARHTFPPLRLESEQSDTQRDSHFNSVRSSITAT